MPRDWHAGFGRGPGKRTGGDVGIAPAGLPHRGSVSSVEGLRATPLIIARKGAPDGCAVRPVAGLLVGKASVTVRVKLGWSGRRSTPHRPADTTSGGCRDAGALVTADPGDAFDHVARRRADAGCQRPVGSARGRSPDVPGGGHEICPLAVMSVRTSRLRGGQTGGCATTSGSGSSMCQRRQPGERWIPRQAGRRASPGTPGTPPSWRHPLTPATRSR